MNHPAPGSATHDRDGFSMMELILVMAILAIILAIAVPRYAGAAGRYQADMAARRIVADLDLARRCAMAGGSGASVTFDTAADSYAAPGVRMTGSTAALAVSLAGEPYKADLVSADLGGDATVTFDAWGAPDSGGTIVIRAGSEQRTVLLDAATGKAGVQ